MQTCANRFYLDSEPSLLNGDASCLQEDSVSHLELPPQVSEPYRQCLKGCNRAAQSSSRRKVTAWIQFVSVFSLHCPGFSFYVLRFGKYPGTLVRPDFLFCLIFRLRLRVYHWFLPRIYCCVEICCFFRAPDGHCKPTKWTDEWPVVPSYPSFCAFAQQCNFVHRFIFVPTGPGANLQSRTHPDLHPDFRMGCLSGHS